MSNAPPESPDWEEKTLSKFEDNGEKLVIWGTEAHSEILASTDYVNLDEMV